MTDPRGVLCCAATALAALVAAPAPALQLSPDPAAAAPLAALRAESPAPLVESGARQAYEAALARWVFFLREEGEAALFPVADAPPAVDPPEARALFGGAIGIGQPDAGDPLATLAAEPARVLALPPAPVRTLPETSRTGQRLVGLAGLALGFAIRRRSALSPARPRAAGPG